MNRQERRRDRKLRKRAERDFKRAMDAYDVRLESEQARFDERLRDPDTNEQLGLPRDLPEFTIEILRFTQAMDIVGPTLPSRKRFYELHGVMLGGDDEAASG